MAQAKELDTDWDGVSEVISSQYRTATMKALHVQPKTPSEIAEGTNLSTAHISRALKQLKELNMVELLVSEDRKKGRIYGTTDYGAPIAEEVANRD